MLLTRQYHVTLFVFDIVVCAWDPPSLIILLSYRVADACAGARVWRFSVISARWDHHRLPFSVKLLRSTILVLPPFLFSLRLRAITDTKES